MEIIEEIQFFLGADILVLGGEGGGWKRENQGKQWQSRQRLNPFAETHEKLDIYSTSRNLDQVQQGFLQTLRNSKKFLLSQCHVSSHVTLNIVTNFDPQGEIATKPRDPYGLKASLSFTI